MRWRDVYKRQADEIGNGIVPLDAFEREYREQTGRAEILLAKKADEVVRVICCLLYTSQAAY